jgi:oligoribonuclease
MSGRLFAFVDIETTGLDPDTDSIIEIAWAFTDERFEIVGTPTSMLVEPRGWDSFAAAMRNTPVVKAMHTRSGLLAEMDRTNLTDLDDVAELLRGDIQALPEHTSLHLAGFSVHFDRAFLEANGFRHLLVEHFHHRHLDLSATKLLLDSIGVPYDKPENLHPHRALSDVFESIHQARMFAVQFAPHPGALVA